MPTRSKASTPPSEDSIPRVKKAVLAVVARNVGDLSTVRKWGHPWRAGRDLVLVVGAFRQHVGVEFWRGSTIEDPHHLLEGTGKNLRHVKIRTVAEATSPEFAELVRAAVRLDAREPPRKP